jgi:hypothetical protein
MAESRLEMQIDSWVELFSETLVTLSDETTALRAYWRFA